MTPDDLRAIAARQTTEADWLNWLEQERYNAHEDRGALLDLCRRLAKVIEEQARELGREVCPLCGDPECPAPLLEALTQGAS